MGVAGDFLPRVLESTGRLVDLKDYREGVLVKKGRKRPLRIGIDVSAWIYRAGFAFGEKLMHDERHLTSYGRANLQKEQQQEEEGEREEEAHKEDDMAEKVRDYCEACASYVLRRLELLKEESNADLLVVFDGRTPPIKTATVSQRKKSREVYQNLRGEGNEAGTMTNHTVEADIEERVKANRRAGPGEHVSRIVDLIIEKLRKRATTNDQTEENGKNRNDIFNDNCVDATRDYLAAWMVAPYEADSQLAYLSKQSFVDLVITEDTDLIAHGCRSVLYKCLENHNSGGTGNSHTFDVHVDITCGKLIDFQDLGGTKVFSGSSKADLTDFTPIMMAVLFVLLGCDYNGHTKLKGIGLLKASKIVRKAFLESSAKPMNETGSETSQTQSQSQSQCEHRIIPMSPASVASPRKNAKKNHNSALNMVWKEAYEQSYDSMSVYTEEFKAQYQKAFCEALWMYRHPIVFDPMIRSCIQCPSINDGLGDPELLQECKEYSELASNPIRIQQVVGELPPTQEECIAIAEGRSHIQWKLRKPTPIYENNDEKCKPDNGRAEENHGSLKKKRKSRASSKKKNSTIQTSPAFRSKRNKIANGIGNEHNTISSTQSDRRRSLDSDEIACVAAGGFKKSDKRPTNEAYMSRNLFATSADQNQKEQQPLSPNLLASTTPEQSTQSSSKATLSDATMALSGTQSSSKATQTPKTSQSSSKMTQTPKTSQSSSKSSINLLASSQSNSQSQFETPFNQIQQQQQQNQDDPSNWQTPSPFKPKFQSQVESQTPEFSTQEDVLANPTQSEEGESSNLFTQDPASPKSTRTPVSETPRRKFLPRAAKKTPPSAYRTPEL